MWKARRTISSTFYLPSLLFRMGRRDGGGFGQRAVDSSLVLPLACTIAVVKYLELLGETIAPDGTVMKLIRRGNEYIILADGKSLMSSAMHGSEEALATFACSTPKTGRALRAHRRPWNGLHAARDARPASARTRPSWSPSSSPQSSTGIAARSAPSPRTAQRQARADRVADVAVTLSPAPRKFDAMLLDVDNGPTAFTASNNAWLYETAASPPLAQPSRSMVCWPSGPSTKIENSRSACATANSA